MSPKPSDKNDTPFDYGYKPRMSRRPIIAGLAFSFALTCVVIAGVLAGKAYGREGGQARLDTRPAAHVRASTVCPLDDSRACRRALIRAYEGLAWAKRQRLRAHVLPANLLTPLEVGRELALRRGWGGRQFGCVAVLWSRESGWVPTKRNYAGSGAYGIPQALPGSKMASYGDDWPTNAATQIRWGYGYIAARYGTPCGALAHSDAQGWY